MKRVGLLVLILGAASAGAGGYAWWINRGAEDEQASLTLFGNVEIRDADLAFNGEGHITEVLVEEGDNVAAGQVLARLDIQRLLANQARIDAEIEAQSEVVKRLEAGTRKQEIEQARANVSAAEARVANAQRVVKRLRDTATMGASSAQDLDDAEAQLEVEQAMLDVRKQELELAIEGPRKEDIAEARARLVARRADLQLLQRRIDDATLVSPGDGVIQHRILEPGEFATPARPVFTLALQNPKWVRAYIPEPDLGRIHNGISARIQSDSFPDKTFDAWVGFISPTAEFTPKTVQTTDLRTRLVYEVRVYVRDPRNELRLGQPVSVFIDESVTETRPASTTTAKALN